MHDIVGAPSYGGPVQKVIEVYRGRFVYGLGQTLAVWLAVVLVVPIGRSLAAATVCLSAGLLTCIVLGKWHQRRARADSAVGAFTGVVLWPLLTGAVVMAITIVSTDN